MNAEGAKKKSVQMWIWIVLAGAAVMYLVLSSIQGTQLPYVNADELPGVQGRMVRVAGKVAVGGIQSDGAGDVSIRFALIDEHGDTVYVDYTGVRPDAFREGAQAVAEGNYNAQNKIFNAVLLQAKCPSKYEVGTPGSAIPAADRAGSDAPKY